VAYKELVPTDSATAGTVIVATPLTRVPLKEPVPASRITEPVGVGLPAKVTVTLSGCPARILDWLGETVTVGVVFPAAVTVTELDPDAVLKLLSPW
jgi:hypothetical protein